MAVAQLKAAIISCELEFIRSAILTQPALIVARDEDDDTLMHIAVNQHQWRVVELLIEMGINFDLTGCSARTPLICSVMEKEWKSFEILTRNKACISETDALNENLMHKIAWSGNVEALRLLMERYSKREISHLLAGKNVTGARPFMQACLQGHSEMVLFLLNNFKIDITETDDFEMNILQQLSPFTIAHGPIFTILRTYISQQQQQQQQQQQIQPQFHY